MSLKKIFLAVSVVITTAMTSCSTGPEAKAEALPAPEKNTAKIEVMAAHIHVAPRPKFAVDTVRWSANKNYAEIVIDAKTDSVIYNQHADDSRQIASLTKIMTAYLVFDAISKGTLKEDQILTASKYVENIPATEVGFHAGDQATVSQALTAMLSISANDAAVLLAEAVAGSESAFAKEMTARADSLGALRTKFRTANGLPASGQKSSAHDIAVIFARVYRDFPDLFKKYFSPRYTTWSKINNHHQMAAYSYVTNCGLGYNNIDAVGQKGGFTNAAGFCLAAVTDNGKKSYVVVTLGAKTYNDRVGRVVKIASALKSCQP
jgi:D-alanyl-D-alanine carboxypeptidase